MLQIQQEPLDSSNSDIGDSEDEEEIKFETKGKKDPSQQFLHGIPYPAPSCILWSPQGQLMIINNVQSQKGSSESRQEINSQKDLQAYLFPSKRRKNQEPNISSSKGENVAKEFQDQNDDIEFIHQGIKILSEGESDGYDFLYPRFSNINQQYSQFQQLETFTSSKQNGSLRQRHHNENQFNIVNHEFFDFSEDMILGEQFKNLLKQIDHEKKRGQLDFNTQINIYDFSKYNFQGIDQFQRFMDNLDKILKLCLKSMPVESPATMLYQMGLETFFNHPNSQLSQVFDMKTYKKGSFEEEQLQISFLQIIFRNLIKTWIRKGSNLNLLDSSIYYISLVWETLFNSLSLKEQLYKIFEDIPELPDYQKVLNDLKMAKQQISEKILEGSLTSNLVMNVAPFFKENLQTYRVKNCQKHFTKEAVFCSSQFGILERLEVQNSNKLMCQRIKRYKELTDVPKISVKTTINVFSHKTHRFITMTRLINEEQRVNILLKSKKRAFNSLQVLQKYIKVSNPILGQRLLKYYNKYFEVQTFIIHFNKALQLINHGSTKDLDSLLPQYVPEVQVQVTQCSVCQVKIINGQYVVCPKCKHGGHRDHLIQWFQKQPNCPFCFNCQCFQFQT